MGMFDGKVVIVTGAGGGLGRAHALEFAKEGAKLVVNDLGGTREGSGTGTAMADQVVAEIAALGGEAVPSYDDVSSTEGGLNMLKTALDAFGRVDVLVNNAGIIRDKSFLKMEEGWWDLVIQVHTRQLYAITQPVVRWMVENEVAGKIVNTTSLAGLLGNYGQTNYATAKAGVAGFTRTLAAELRKKGIQVNAVAPVAKTRMTEDISMVPDDMVPEQISKMVLYLSSDLSDAITGRVFGVHGQQIFEYQMTQTPGVTKDGAEHWGVQEIADRILDIARPESAGTEGADDGDDDVSRAFACIPAGLKADDAANWTAVMHWVIKGASDQTLSIADGAASHAVGLSGAPTCTIKTDADTVLAMFKGELDPTKAFMQGKITADNLPDMMKMGGAFDFPTIGAKIAAALGGGGAAEAAPAPAKAVDPASLVGRRYAADYVVAGQDEMVAYAHATNDPNPHYVDVDRDGGTVAPPLFPVRLFHRLMFQCVGDPDLQLDMLRLVHGEEDLTWHQPLRPGDIVNLRATLEFISQKSKGLVVGWRMYGIVGGVTAVEAAMSVFVRKQMLPGVEPGTTFGTLPAGPTSKPEGAPSLESSMAVALDQPVRYAAASLDDNPIHLDEEVAKKGGLPGVILHGLCTMAFGSKALVDGLLDSDPSRLRRYAVRFTKMVQPGETLTTRVWDAGALADGSHGYHVQIENQDGDVVAGNGWAEVASA
ncbi:MAG: SDR family NAD(P)-dependent oxidoreductase [Deltaproteobacteria bacterium]|nr:SDR family NAD(P)-dependent oxidoreductase [Deltaproteobacteria bacterium]